MSYFINLLQSYKEILKLQNFFIPFTFSVSLFIRQGNNYCISVECCFHPFTEDVSVKAHRSFSNFVVCQNYRGLHRVNQIISPCGDGWLVEFSYLFFSFNLPPFGYQKCFHFSLLFKLSVFTFCQLFCGFTYIMFWEAVGKKTQIREKECL